MSAHKTISLFIAFVLFSFVAACNGPTSPATVEVVPEVTDEVVPDVTAEVVSEQTAEVVSEETVAEPVELRTVIGDEPPTLDPALSTDTTSTYFIDNMFVGLTDFDEEAELIPALAKDWEVSNDGLQWTFNLRDDIQWINRNLDTGEISVVRPVIAQDVVYGVIRTIDPNTASDFAYILYPIKGAEALNTAEPDDENFDALLSEVGVTAADDTTVIFTLETPAPYFPSIVSLSIASPQPQEAVEQWGNDWTETGNIVTNGPYTLYKWDHGSEIWLEKNPHWIQAEDTQIEMFGGPIIQETSTAMAMYESNELDILSDPPGLAPPVQDMDRIQADEQLSKELFTAPQLCTSFYGFINNKPPFDDALVRKAFAMTINREDLIEFVVKGGQTPANSFVPPGIFGNLAGQTDLVGDFLVGPDYSSRVEEAQALLAQAGYPEGTGIDIVLAHNDDEAHSQMAQAIQAMWLEAFPNAQIALDSQEWGVYLETIDIDAPDEEKPNIYRIAWCADYPDANNWLNEVFNSQSYSNYSMFNNSEFDQLVEEAAIEKDPEKRKELYTKAEQILINEETAIAPLYYHVYTRLYKPWITPVINPVGVDPIDKWHIDLEARQAAINN